MKAIVTILLLSCSTILLMGQKQLDIQGNTSSTDTVAMIKVNYVGEANVVGLSVYSF